MSFKVGDKVRVKPLAKDCRHWWGRVGTITFTDREMPTEFQPIKIQFRGVRGSVVFWRDELELVESNPLEQKGE